LAKAGIGIRGLTRLRLCPETESSIVHLVGAFILHGGHLLLHTLAAVITTITSIQLFVPEACKVITGFLPIMAAAFTTGQTMAQASWQVDFGVVDWGELAFVEHVAVNFTEEVVAVADFTVAAWAVTTKRNASSHRAGRIGQENSLTRCP